MEIKTKSGKKFEFAAKDGKYQIDGQTIDFDLVEQGSAHFHAILNGKGYTINLLQMPNEGKGYILKVNGKEFEVSVKSKTELLLEKMGMKKDTGTLQQELKAPMPGLISSIVVKEGQRVQKGDPLLILEAMKMENILKSFRDGEIKSIKVTEKQSVEKNDLLITFA